MISWGDPSQSDGSHSCRATGNSSPSHHHPHACMPRGKKFTSVVLVIRHWFDNVQLYKTQCSVVFSVGSFFFRYRCKCDGQVPLAVDSSDVWHSGEFLERCDCDGCLCKNVAILAAILVPRRRCSKLKLKIELINRERLDSFIFSYFKNKK